MEDFPTWLAVGLIIGLGPVLFSRRKKQKTPTVVVHCPYCGIEVGLEKVRNYICFNCNHAVAYFQTSKNVNPRTDLVNYQCSQCNTLNFQNVKYCLKCGAEHGANFRY